MTKTKEAKRMQDMKCEKCGYRKFKCQCLKIANEQPWRSELLEAAKDMLDWFDVKRDLDDDEQTRVYQAMLAAIAKAEGK